MMDGTSQRNKSGYFSSMNTRLGSRLPPGVSQPPHFAKQSWDRAPARGAAAAASHVPHIRNPQLRQYYLQGTSWDLSRRLLTDVSSAGGVLCGQADGGKTVLSVSSGFSSSSSAPPGPRSWSSQQLQPRVPPVHRQLLVHTEEKGAAEPELELDVDSGPGQKRKVEADQSPSPEAEYDKLLDVEAVPTPDGQLYLLALPPECCQGEGPEATPYLKLFCSYITDRKGVISGVLLVTSYKLFFDPCKTHPLVKEHGCEDYLLSCSVDSLQSVCFFSDITHIHFNPSQQRRKHKNFFQKFKSPRSRKVGLPNQAEEPHPAPAACDQKQEGDPRPLTFCCGGQDAASQVKPDLPQAAGADPSCEKNQASAAARPPAGAPGPLMFVRLRVQACSERGGSGAGHHLGPDRGSSRREAWLALSQESAERLQAHLKLCRPHLNTQQGDMDPDDESFVLVEDGEEEQASQKLHGSADDWEMVSMEDSEGRPAPLPEREPEGLHQVLESSYILEASHVRELCQELPARTVGRTWRLTYSTSRHGASLKSLYRKLQATDSPALVVIKDALDEVFGAFLSHPLRPSEEFYGTGETFLFMLHPRFKCFKWTGENSFFIKGYMDSFAVGGGSGHFGLWVDENLYLGHSSPCYTFNNCCLSETNDFRVMELEVWTFS